MEIQEQFNKLILRQVWIEQETQKCSLLLKKQRRLCLSFHKEHKSFVNAIPLKCDLIFMSIK